MSRDYVTLLGAEEASRAASRLESAATSADRASNQLDESVRKLEVLTSSGYGNNWEKLVEFIESGKLDRLIEALEKHG